jgi:hypothetical protein
MTAKKMSPSLMRICRRLDEALPLLAFRIKTCVKIVSPIQQPQLDLVLTRAIKRDVIMTSKRNGATQRATFRLDAFAFGCALQAPCPDKKRGGSNSLMA